MMRSQLKNYFFALSLLLFCEKPGYSQSEFFRSKQGFTKEQLSNFYSSLVIHDELLLFNANDYYLYAYNKNDGSLKWSVETGYKTTIPVFVQNDIVYSGISKNQIQQAAQFELASGKLIKTLPFGPLATKPFIKNDLLYGTAIYNYGCIIAYDLRRDIVSWSRFIAHGYSRTPYYQQNSIMANAGADNWVKLGYDGALLDTTCAVKSDLFVEVIACVNNFTELSHDGREIKTKLSADVFGQDLMGEPDMLTTEKFTFILNEDKLSVLSGKLKKKQQVRISSLVADLDENGNAKLVKADNENIWLLYGDILLQYNHESKRLVRLTDLATWQPRQVVLDENNIWLISGKDGLLYGVSL